MIVPPPRHATRFVLLILSIGSPLFADELSEVEKLFALKVQPVFRTKCFACHGEEPNELEGGFDLRTRASMMRGGESFGQAVVIPGDAESSYLYAMVRRVEDGYEMPPKESERLTDDETTAIRDWIDGGAPWPADEQVAAIYQNDAKGVVWKTRGGLSDDWTHRKYKSADLWAYQSIRPPNAQRLIQERRNARHENADSRRSSFTDLSKAKQAAAVEDNHVDAFIHAKMRQVGLAPAPPADRVTLIRRATFDLLGLPPTTGEVQRFTNDPQPDEVAFADLVDRLLESPHYGEQWARHWLDVVRYADSSGFANDWERPNAWRYRDYVIRCFNQDKPYDEFVREQVAGDELYRRAIDAEENADPSLLIAAGFLRMGPWEHSGMSVAKITRQMFLDDVTDSVGQVFLAHALQCARCHDHKFDPIPTRDYYSMQAIFATTQFAEIDTQWLPEENLSGMADDRRYHKNEVTGESTCSVGSDSGKSRRRTQMVPSTRLAIQYFAGSKRSERTAGAYSTDGYSGDPRNFWTRADRSQVAVAIPLGNGSVSAHRVYRLQRCDVPESTLGSTSVARRVLGWWGRRADKSPDRR